MKNRISKKQNISNASKKKMKTRKSESKLKMGKRGVKGWPMTDSNPPGSRQA